MIKRLVLKVFPYIAGTMFMLLFILNVVRIAGRTLWGVSWIWMPDFSRLLFVWIVFIGTATVYAAKDHLVMDFIVAKFSGVVRRKLEFGIKLLMLVFLAMLVQQGYIVSMVRMNTPFDMWDFPTGYAYLALPVMSVVMIVLTVEDLLVGGKIASPANIYKE